MFKPYELAETMKVVFDTLRWEFTTLLWKASDIVLLLIVTKLEFVAEMPVQRIAIGSVLAKLPPLISRDPVSTTKAEPSPHLHTALSK